VVQLFFCAVVLAPDSYLDGVDGYILKELSDNLGKPVWRCMFEITRPEVEKIYPNHTRRPSFSFVVNNYELCKSGIFIFSGSYNIYQQISLLKGIFDFREGILITSSLRKKYGAHIIDQRFAFRMHSTENQEETSVVWNIVSKGAIKNVCSL